MFLCDTYVNYDPSVEQVVEMTQLAAEEVRRFGINPKIALLSHSSFGSDDTPTALKMREALAMLHAARPDLDVEGEMHGDAALDGEVRLQVFPNARMRDDANLLIFPTLDAANIAFNLLKTLGTTKPVHILTPTATVRRIVNMTALTAVEATAMQR